MTNMLINMDPMSLKHGDIGTCNHDRDRKWHTSWQSKHYCSEFHYYMGEALIQIHPEYVDIFMHCKNALETYPFYREIMLMSRNEDTGNNLYITPLETNWLWHIQSRYLMVPSGTSQDHYD